MSAIRVKTRVPESRQITISLPQDFPVGEVDVEVSVCEPVTEITIVLPPDVRPKLIERIPSCREVLPEK